MWTPGCNFFINYLKQALKLLLSYKLRRAFEELLKDRTVKTVGVDKKNNASAMYLFL